jgi:hypothetical protein
MTSKNLYKASSILLNLVLIIFLLIPFSTELSPLEGTGNEFGHDWDWIDIYILHDEILILFFSPLYFLWGVLYFIKKGLFRKTLKVITLALSGFYFLYGLFLFKAPLQDFSPNYGVFVLFSFFPLLSFVFYLDFLRQNFDIDYFKWGEILDV